MAVSHAPASNPLEENAIVESNVLGASALTSLHMGRNTLDAERARLERLRIVPQMQCLDGPAEGTQIWMEWPVLLIGRGQNCHFKLSDPAVAPLHAKLKHLVGGSYLLAAQHPEEAPIFLRRYGFFRSVQTLHLVDGMVIRLGKHGPRLRFRYLGGQNQPGLLARFVLARGHEEPLLPVPMLQERLDALWRTAPLQPPERHTIQQAIRQLPSLQFYRRWFFLWVVIGGLLGLLGLSRQLLLSDTRQTLASVQRQLESLWLAQHGTTRSATSGGLARAATAPSTRPAQASDPNARPEVGGTGTDPTPSTNPGKQAGRGFTEGSGLSASDEQTLMANDPLAQQLLRLLRSVGIVQPALSSGMVSLVHSELEKEVQRIKHRFELEAFQARTLKYQPRIEDIFRREFQLPPMLASLAWLESDFRLDAERPDGRLGMWQLSEEVAIQYDLITDKGEDFRMDFEASTRGSARYLADLLTRFGLESLPLVVLAFHLGPDAVEDTLRTQQLWRTEQRTFPYLLRLAGTGDAHTLTHAQLQYVGRFFAVQIIAANKSFYLQ